MPRRRSSGFWQIGAGEPGDKPTRSRGQLIKEEDERSDRNLGRLKDASATASCEVYIRSSSGFETGRPLGLFRSLGLLASLT